MSDKNNTSHLDGADAAPSGANEDFRKYNGNNIIAMWMLLKTAFKLPEA